MNVAAPGSVNRSSKFRGDDDHYPTPRGAIVPFLKKQDFITGMVWECACGDGAMTKVLNEFGHYVFPSNLVDRGFGATGIDFLKQTEMPHPKIRTVMTNPPFALWDEFVLHALGLGADVVSIFGRLKCLEGRKRYDRLHSKHPPAYVWVFVNRVKFYAGDIPKDEQPGWNTEAFAWFTWFGNHYAPDGPQQFDWLITDDGLQESLL